MIFLKKKLKQINSLGKKMLKDKLKSNAKKIDLFLKKYLKSQKKSLLINPMIYGVLSGGKKLDQVLFSLLENYLILNQKNY